jgi:hypothetical protein
LHDDVLVSFKQEGFTTKRPAGGQARQAGKPASGWASPQWRAVQANLTQQLKDADGSFNSYRVTHAAPAQTAMYAA